MSHTLIQLVVADRLEEAVIDWLLHYPQPLVFETGEVRQYGQPLHSLKEKVAGCRQQVLFTLELPSGQVDDLRSGLYQHFSTELVRFRAMKLE
ncbi:Protein of unknown function [Methylobacillus rhizosphaerae]|uniref:DUF3240 domain-containing protein n=1 Tax=Methylobacillus rhizosphaerae TaxID=551994 RepID=A0A238ZPT0_9PROT|nr:DUF3240 family protein [Methylobacillus rhizosphaerae]SNR84724.1 Protein of unknown function [Methylobacillus rhizosphaerae]